MTWDNDLKEARHRIVDALNALTHARDHELPAHLVTRLREAGEQLAIAGDDITDMIPGRVAYPPDAP